MTDKTGELVLPKITYRSSDGISRTVDVNEELSVMECAVKNNIPGIDAECGGACACGTCHVYVDPAWVDAVGPPNDLERDLLEFANDPCPNSRLSCQIKVTASLDGLVVETPESQKVAL
jgi:ferredoxin, 2Fe-2S